MANEPKLQAQRGFGRVAFLAAKDEIQKLVQAGWPMKSIYDYLGDRMPIKISQFRHYVNVYIGQPHRQRRKSPAMPRKNSVSQSPSSAEQQLSGTVLALEDNSAAEQRKPRAERGPEHLPEKSTSKTFEWKPRDPQELM